MCRSSLERALRGGSRVLTPVAKRVPAPMRALRHHEARGSPPLAPRGVLKARTYATSQIVNSGTYFLLEKDGE